LEASIGHSGEGPTELGSEREDGRAEKEAMQARGRAGEQVRCRASAAVFASRERKVRSTRPAPGWRP
jgi:hypothetical protein